MPAGQQESRRSPEVRGKLLGCGWPAGERFSMGNSSTVRPGAQDSHRCVMARQPRAGVPPRVQIEYFLPEPTYRYVSRARIGRISALSLSIEYPKVTGEPSAFPSTRFRSASYGSSRGIAACRRDFSAGCSRQPDGYPAASIKVAAARVGGAVASVSVDQVCLRRCQKMSRL